MKICMPLVWFLITMSCELLIGQESEKIKLLTVETKVILSPKSRSAVFHLKVYNNTNERLRLLAFYDTWKNYVHEVDSLPNYVMPGFNLEIFDTEKQRYFPTPYSIFTEQMYSEIINAESVDSLKALIKSRYGDVENWKLEERMRILANEKWLSPGDSLETKLNLSFQGFIFDKGQYELFIYYVINNKLYEYVDRKKEDFWGWVRSNKVSLIVE